MSMEYLELPDLKDLQDLKGFKVYKGSMEPMVLMASTDCLVSWGLKVPLVRLVRLVHPDCREQMVQTARMVPMVRRDLWDLQD